MLDKSLLLKIFAKTLKIKNFNLDINSSTKDIPEWDSMAHLSILFEIDKATKGKASKIKDLAKCKKISDFHKLLIKAKLSK